MKKINIFLVLTVLFLPYLASASIETAEASSGSILEQTISGTINPQSLSATSKKPTLSGTATGTKTIQVIVKKEGSKKTFYKKEVRVRNDMWKVKISKNLPYGTYEVIVLSSKATSKKEIASGELVINSRKSVTNSASTLSVNSVPLLFGGNTKANGSVPVSYLQITNNGKENTTLKGFWIKQNGSASTKSVVGFTSIDDKDVTQGSVMEKEGSTPFKNGLAYVPVNSIFLPGQMRLITVRAILAGNVYADIGKQLQLNVTGLDANSNTKGTFPMPGTTWTINN
jgi:hypothetical protein